MDSKLIALPLCSLEAEHYIDLHKVFTLIGVNHELLWSQKLVILSCAVGLYVTFLIHAHYIWSKVLVLIIH